jgi:hypothetical protein
MGYRLRPGLVSFGLADQGLLLPKSAGQVAAFAAGLKYRKRLAQE